MGTSIGEIRHFALSKDEISEINTWLEKHFCTKRKQDYFIDLRLGTQGLVKCVVCPCGMVHPLDK